METQPIDHPLLAGKTSVEDILTRVHSPAWLMESVRPDLTVGDHFHSGSEFGGAPDDWTALNQSPFSDPLISAVSEEQDFLQFTARELEEQASMLRLLQERGSTSSWNGDLSAGVKIIAAANPSDGR